MDLDLPVNEGHVWRTEGEEIDFLSFAFFFSSGRVLRSQSYCLRLVPLSLSPQQLSSSIHSQLSQLSPLSPLQSKIEEMIIALSIKRKSFPREQACHITYYFVYFLFRNLPSGTG